MSFAACRTPLATKAVDDPGALASANASTPVEVSEQKDLIEKEIARLEAATSATGTVNRLAGSLKEQAGMPARSTACVSPR
jgi:hypothetical protein